MPFTQNQQAKKEEYANTHAVEILKDRIEFEKKIPKKKYVEIAQNNKLNWKELSKTLLYLLLLKDI